MAGLPGFGSLRSVSPWILQRIIWIPTRFVLSVLGHLKIFGVENLRMIPKNAIFACNHLSEMDVFMVPGALPMFSRFAPIFYTAREKGNYSLVAPWKRAIYGGLFFKAWGAYPVKLGLNDYAKSVSDLVRILHSGGSLCIFPEGRKSLDGSIGEGKGGVAYLSWATGYPVVPVRIGGTFRMSLRDLILGRRTLSIAFGTPVRVTTDSSEMPSPLEFKAHAASIMDMIRKLPDEAPSLKASAILS